MRHTICLILLVFGLSPQVRAASVPTDFVDEQVFGDLAGVFCIRFAPDGRLFMTEWRRGWIRVAHPDGSGGWTLQAEPFHRFETPDAPGNGGVYSSTGVASGSLAARRGTLRGFDFDPDFATNGRIYATYMHDNERDGYRVSRIQASATDPDVSDGSETVLFRARFHPDGSQPDAHNGGGLVIGGDGRVYVSFGDGWTASSAQHTGVFAGKVIRIDRDGSIPADNPFYGSFSGNARAIYALGLRNPICLTRHPATGRIYANSFQGSDKANMYHIVAGANYGHGGGGAGTAKGSWLSTKITTGGNCWTAWYPADGPWPAAYRGTGFTSNWNGSGEIVQITGSHTSPGKQAFASNVEFNNRPVVAVAVGPDGHLYYTAREYGEPTQLRRIRYVAPSGLPEVHLELDAATLAEGQSTTLWVRRGGDLSASLSVALAASGSASGGDVSGVPTGVSFASGVDTRSFTVTAVDDTVTESDETRTISIQSGTDYTVGTPGSLDVVIPANDIPLREPDSPGAVDPGLAFEYRHLVDPTTVDDIAGGTLAASGTRSVIDVTTPDGRTTDLGFVFVGFFSATGDGEYTFSTASDDGSTVYVGNTLVVDNDGNHGVQTRSGTIALAAGLHAVTVRYFQGVGPGSMALTYQGPGVASPQPVPDYLWYRTPPADGERGLADRGSVGAYLDGALPASASGTFPATLSATGAFTDLAALTPRSGLLPYDVNSPLWSDGARKARWIAVPDGQTITFSATGEWAFPTGTVLVKHFELGTDEDDPALRTRLETRFLVKTGTSSWYGVTYRWRSDGSDADLLGSAGATRDVTIQRSGGGTRTQTWTFPSRNDCMTCHNSAAGFALGVNTRQLNGEMDYPVSGNRDNQLRAMSHVGLFDQDLLDTAIAGYTALVRIDDAGESLEKRVRSYLDVNCGQCHRPDGPGQGGLDARYDTPLASQGLIDGAVNDSLGIEGARVLKPKDRWRSVLHHRVKVRDGDRQMPPIGSSEIDEAGVATITAYIDSLSGTPALAPPSLSPAGGSYAGSVTVQASHPTSGVELRYRTDGQVPTASDPVWPAGGLTLTADADLRVNASASGYATGVSTREVYAVTPSDPGGVIGEAGTVATDQASSSQWHGVVLRNHYVDPVVVASITTYAGGHPSTLRVRNVTGDGFEFQIDEYDYLDGGHATETIAYLVVEAGSHVLSDGTVVQAGHATADDQGTAVSFPQAFAATPVVVSQIASTNAAQAGVTRHDGLDATGFQLVIHSEEASGRSYDVAERVGWIAIDQHAAFADGHAAVRSADVHTDAWRTLSFGGGFAATPVAVADLQTLDGGDPCDLRMRGLAPGQVDLMVEEEQSANSEIGHTSERVGAILFAAGDIGGDPGDTQAPTAPTGLTAANTDQTSTDLSWSPASDDVGVTAYHVYQDGVSIATVSGTGYAVTCLSAGTSYDFAVRASDAAGNLGPASTVLTVTTPSDPGGVIGEAGTVVTDQASSSQWHGVSLRNSYVDPVVVASITTYAGGQPSTLRVRNVTGGGFEFQIDEYDYLDGGHTTETIAYLVVEAGSHVLSDGTVVQAGHANADSTGTTVGFAQAFGATPVVVSQIASTNAAQAGVTRHDGLDATGFQLVIHSEEASGRSYDVAERVGWIAIDQHAAFADGHAAVRSADVHTDAWRTLSFGGGFAATPVAVADLQTLDGGDPCDLRMRGLSTSQVDLMVEEEQSANSEIGHTTERVGVVLFAAGDIGGDSGDSGDPGDTQAPTAPTGLAAANTDHDSTDLSWNPASDDVGVTGYRVFQDGALIATVSGTTRTVTGLAAETTYRFTVRAEDAAGNVSPASGALDVTTAAEPVVPLGLHAWWAFDDGSGSQAWDGSGNGFHGTLVGPTWVAGRHAGALHFDGVDDHVDLGTLDVSGSALTLCAWIRADSFPGPSQDARIISKANGVGEGDHWWMLSGLGSPTRLRFRLKAGGSTTTLVGSEAIPLGTWVHVAAVYDGSQMRVYHDGVLVGSTGKTGTLDQGPTVPAWIGGNPTAATDRPFDGLIDDVRIYQSALDAAAIQEVMTGLGGTPQ